MKIEHTFVRAKQLAFFFFFFFFSSHSMLDFPGIVKSIYVRITLYLECNTRIHVFRAF